MHYLSFIYLVSQPLPVSGIPTAQHQEVFTAYVTRVSAPWQNCYYRDILTSSLDAGEGSFALFSCLYP
jgi:hypothetical protein